MNEAPSPSIREVSPDAHANRGVVFNRPAIDEKGTRYVMEALASGHHSGDGPFTRRCHDSLQKALGVRRALLTTSCTHALEMAALLIDIGPGDEVIVPSFTFVSTANAFALRGARIVFADIREDTLNLDETALPSLITRRTKAVVPVHYAGVGCEMDAVLPLCEQRGVAVIEDNAHGLFGKYRGRYLGSFGRLATQSFHETKNFSCGEGGALVVNDPTLIERAEIIREKGTNRSRFFRGQVDKYTWVDLGSSYLPSDILAAVLLGQLESAGAIQAMRKRWWDRYATALRAWADARSVRLPYVPPHCDQAYHMFYVVMPTLDLRQAFLRHLKERNVMAVFHYVPLHSAPMGASHGARPSDCPVTSRLADQLVRLPFHNSLSEVDQSRVIEAVLSFRG